ncbi:MAG: apolipoprotein N-acyltransferase [Demequinaceae bacterium]|nr:apolipoprotein N-acyltransferase [Demequinaceae bacterium]
MKNALLAAATGWVMHLAFPSFGWWPAAAIGLALLWAVLEHTTVWSGFGLGFVAGLGFFLPLLRWTSVGVGPIPWVALAGLESLAVGLFGASWALVRRKKYLKGRLWLEPVVFAALWTSAEQLRSIVPFGGFPWGRLAFSQVDGPVVGFAWLGGASLVTFAVAASGGCLGLAFEAVRGKRVVVPVLAATGAIAITMAGTIVPLEADAESGSLRIGVAQGSVPNLGLDSFNQSLQVLKNHVAATEELAEKAPWTPDLVIWPENAADRDPRVDSYTRDAVTASAVLVGSPILLGTMDYSPEEGRYNTSLLWTEDGEVVDVYLKRHPVPFAEYIPIRGFARVFSSAVDRVQTDMIAGGEAGIIGVPSDRLGRDVSVGVVICFEVAYDGLVRDTVTGGGEILVVQTNNANFGLTPESVQQLAMTRFRAIEAGRAAVQASTVGVSAVVMPDGRIVSQTRLFTADYLLEEVPLRTSTTPATRIGGYLEWIFLLAPLMAASVAGALSLRGRWEWE